MKSIFDDIYLYQDCSRKRRMSQSRRKNLMQNFIIIHTEESLTKKQQKGNKGRTDPPIILRASIDVVFRQ